MAHVARYVADIKRPGSLYRVCTGDVQVKSVTTCLTTYLPICLPTYLPTGGAAATRVQLRGSATCDRDIVHVSEATRGIPRRCPIGAITAR